MRVSWRYVVRNSLIEKFLLLRDAYDELKGDTTRLEFEVESLKDAQDDNEEEVKQNWEKIKLKEGKTSVLQGVPKSLPALVKAIRIQEKVAGVGFDWEEPQQVFEKVEEELQEFNTEIKAKNQVAIESEFGDVLFSLINYARFLNINPENALERTNKKFIKRFQYLEQQAKLKKRSLSEMSLSEMDVIWEEAKRQQEP